VLCAPEGSADEYAFVLCAAEIEACADEYVYVLCAAEDCAEEYTFVLCTPGGFADEYAFVLCAAEGSAGGYTFVLCAAEGFAEGYGFVLCAGENEGSAVGNPVAEQRAIVSVTVSCIVVAYTVTVSGELLPLFDLSSFPPLLPGLTGVRTTGAVPCFDPRFAEPETPLSLPPGAPTTADRCAASNNATIDFLMERAMAKAEKRKRMCR
jgi:hypothetical protein